MLKLLPRLSVLAAGILVGAQAYAADIPGKAPLYAPEIRVRIGVERLLCRRPRGVRLGKRRHLWRLQRSERNHRGGQVGYNRQIGHFVVGAGGDFQACGESRSDTASVLGISFTVDQKIRWFGAARGRVGYVFGPRMVYATGGAAWQNYKLSLSALGGEASYNATKIGGTAGGGLE